MSERIAASLRGCYIAAALAVLALVLLVAILLVASCMPSPPRRGILPACEASLPQGLGAEDSAFLHRACQDLRELCDGLEPCR